MKRDLVIAVLLCGLVGLFGCSREDGPGQFIYPLQAGNEWFYTHSSLLELESEVISQPETTTRVSVSGFETWVHVGEVVRINIHWESEGYGGDGAQFYQQTPTSLLNVGYCGTTPPYSTPKMGPLADSDPALAGVLRWLDFAPVTGCDGEPTIPYSDYPPALVYPWRLGASWVFRQPPTIGMTIRKSVVGATKVETPAGIFDAYRVEWTYDELPRVHIYDDIAAVGLVRRESRADSIRYTSYEYGEDRYGTLVSIQSLDSLRLR